MCGNTTALPYFHHDWVALPPRPTWRHARAPAAVARASASSRDLCSIHTGKTGGGTINALLLREPLGLRYVVFLHQAFFNSSLLQPQMGSRLSLKYVEHLEMYGGPYAEALPGFLACAGTQRVVFWVRDPVSRFLSTWHDSMPLLSLCIWRAAASMGIVLGNSSSSDSIDLNHAIGVLARRDGGNIGKSTLDFISTIPQGAVGVAAYLTDCSLDFLRRQPLFFVGRTEYMLHDWRVLEKMLVGKHVLNTTMPYIRHHVSFAHTRVPLSESSRELLRAFFEDDIQCMRNLERVGMLSHEYLGEVTSALAVYEHWPMLYSMIF